MEWKSATKNDEGLIKIPKRWLHIHYYEALNILFRFENSLRVFVYAIMKNEFSSKWVECNFSSSGGDGISIKSLVARRLSQSDNFGYLGYDIKAPLMHLTSGELVELITSEAYWSKFKDYFKGNKEIIKNKLLEIGTIRNSLAHFRPMRADDIEVVKQNSKHTLLGVEECLNNVFFQTLRVPTNTKEPWYQHVSTLGTKYVTTTPYYSVHENWIKIELSFKTPTLEKNNFSNHFYAYRLTKINSPAIILKHEVIKDSVTYVSESLGYPTMDEHYNLEIAKNLYFVFRKDVLTEKAEDISRGFSDIILEITEECDLLLQDNLARGNLVEPCSGYSWWNPPSEGQEGKWSHKYQDLARPYQSTDPDEYWGEQSFASDLVAGCLRYPWMPEPISDFESLYD